MTIPTADDPTHRSLYFNYPTFESPVPREMSGSDPLLHDVILVGAGPVGLATALDLAERGIKVVVLETETTIGTGSRAGSLSRRSIEYLASLGIGEQMLAQGMVYDSGWTYFRGKEVFKLAIPGQQGDQFPPMLKLQQCYVEKYLADRVNAHPGIEMRWGHRLEALQNETDHVDLQVNCPHGQYHMRGRYVVGADGGRSVVRKQIGQHLEGKTFDATFVVADIKMEADKPVGRRFWYDPPWNPGGSVIMHLQPENIWRFDYSLPNGVDDTDELKPERVTQRIADHLAWLGWEMPWELDWMTLYRAHTRVVEKMRVGRTLLVGDAAHLIPIFGVRGLNGGLSDAANLAWKLARVAHDESPDSLLDSYDSEQHMVFAGNREAADLSTRFICPSNVAARTLRDAALQLAQKHETFQPLMDPRQSQPIPLRGSRLVGVSRPRLPLQPGDALPNLRLGGEIEECFINDLVGRSFCIVKFTGGAAHSIQRSTIRTAEEDVPVVEVTIPVGFSEAQGESLRGYTLLVRPDRYIADCWPTDDPEELDFVFARATGAIAPVGVL